MAYAGFPCDDTSPVPVKFPEVKALRSRAPRDILINTGEQPCFIRMFRTPIPNEDQSRLENCGTDQLLHLFKSSAKTGSRVVDNCLLSDAWGTLFSRMYLSAEELVDEMQGGEHRLDDENETLLREFIRSDCRNGGLFIMEVIHRGGKIDRAALIMIADLEDLAGIEYNGTTALHQLADTCDKWVRPAFIRKAGPRLLSQVYDRRGIPVIFTIFSLGDISVTDLDALARVFPREDLKKIMCRSRSGKDALTVFTEIALSLKSHMSLDRNTFFKPSGLKDTDVDNKD
jgi:hypothetical protein